MLYFLALFFPPLAAGWVGGVGTVFLNLLLCLCGLIPGIIHALMLVSRYEADIRHEQLISAITGKNFRAPRSLGAGLVGLAALLIIGALLFLAVAVPALVAVQKKAEQVQTKSKTNARPPLPSNTGWSISEVETTYGAARIKDKTTGWAVWPKFKAHFDNGVVNQIEALELR